MWISRNSLTMRSKISGFMIRLMLWYYAIRKTTEVYLSRTLTVLFTENSCHIAAKCLVSNENVISKPTIDLLNTVCLQEVNAHCRVNRYWGIYTKSCGLSRTYALWSGAERRARRVHSRQAPRLSRKDALRGVEQLTHPFETTGGACLECTRKLVSHARLFID